MILYTGIILSILGLIILLVLIMYFILNYKKLKKLKEESYTQWKILEKEIKTKFSHIPSILEIFKEYAKNENEIVKSIIASRNKYTVSNTPEQLIDSNNQLTESLKKLIGLTEKYPNLKTDKNFQKLTQSLSETETNLNIEKTKYENIVLNLNNKIKKFPSNIINNYIKIKN